MWKTQKKISGTFRLDNLDLSLPDLFDIKLGEGAQAPITLYIFYASKYLYNYRLFQLLTTN